MDLYLDSADIAALGPLLATGLFRGVTTNPLILQRANVRLDEVPTLVEWLLERTDGDVFVQTTAQDADDIKREGSRLRAMSDRLVVKVPATRDGLTATRRLVDAGVPTLVTAVYGPRQAVLAAAAGAQWIAPYLGRMTEAGRDGHEQVARMVQVLRGSGTRTLVASIRSPEDVVGLAAAGADAVTLGADVAQALFDEPLTEAAVAQFDAAAAALR
ncbi:transaldolase family protein [Puerhibacterium sp. TATVAM-FAB25]|uniref:transaldolase family protein n=1 Tax=Puerhibacterium sp. TATVAM-FAB25 TaxID=3093699 RepID=UPI00397AD0C5